MLMVQCWPRSLEGSKPVRVTQGESVKQASKQERNGKEMRERRNLTTVRVATTEVSSTENGLIHHDRSVQ